MIFYIKFDLLYFHGSFEDDETKIKVIIIKSNFSIVLENSIIAYFRHRGRIRYTIRALIQNSSLKFQTSTSSDNNVSRIVYRAISSKPVFLQYLFFFFSFLFFFFFLPFFSCFFCEVLHSRFSNRTPMSQQVTASSV